jgi:transcriptional regulator with XRE-family HTH domain
MAKLFAAHAHEATDGVRGGTVTAGTRPAARGVVAGAVLAAARRSAGLTQEDFAEAAGLSVDTVKRWENGQRPLGNVRAADLARVQRCLRGLGGRPSLLARLPAAIDADAFTCSAMAGDCGQLAAEVTTRPWSALIAWAVKGDPPAEARGVAPSRPLLAPAERQVFLASLRSAAERAAASGTDHLLRHQAYFLAALDTSPEGSAWLGAAARAEGARLRLDGRWSPDWAVARSLTVALACQGDPDPLRWFIRGHIADPVCQEANLVYWAYWAGADAETAPGEEFMVERPLEAQRAAALLRHLADGLSAELPYADLSAESARSLLDRWPSIARRDTQVAAELASRAARMLDGRAVAGSTRAVLSDLHFAARSAA